jgi:hypothetical protein
MEPQLESIIDLLGPQALIGDYIWHHAPGQEPGTYKNILTRIGDVEPGTGRFWLEDGQGEWFFRPVDKEELRIEAGTRIPEDSLIKKLKEKRLQYEEFVVAIPGAPMGQAEVPRGPAPAAPPPVRVQSPEPRRVHVPPLHGLRKQSRILFRRGPW